MPIDNLQLQEIVDKMAKPNGDGWELDHSYAPAFFRLIAPYIKKSAYKSEYNAHGDPEDAFAETQWEVWRALEKYGPRPKGNLFGEYTLKLKTNNILTNREKKRSSKKSCLNFVSESLDGLEALELEGERHYVPPSCLPFDLCVLKEEILARQKKSKIKNRKKRKYRKRKKDVIEQHIRHYKLIRKDIIEQHIRFINDPVEVHILQEDPIEKHIKLMEDPIEKHLLATINDPVEYHICQVFRVYPYQCRN